MDSPRTGYRALDTSDGFINAGDWLQTIPEFSTGTRTFAKCTFSVSQNAMDVVEIAMTGSSTAPPGSAATSNFLWPGQSRAFYNVNFDLVWLRGPNSDTEVEFVAYERGAVFEE